MKPKQLFFRVLSTAVLAALAGCGGGGGSSADFGGSAAGSTPPYPSSGAFGWTLRAAGPTTALKYGLSLVHPSQPDAEYVIEVASSVVSDAILVSSGTVNASSLQTTALQPHSLIYIVGGDVRSMPMQANGTAPLSRVQRSQSTSACSFIIDAIDYATPLNSRFIVSSAGPDGQCGTADDGRAEVQLTATGGIQYTPISADKPLDVVRDPATLAPRGWIYPRSVVLWGSTGNSSNTSFSLRTNPALPISAVVANTSRSSLVDDGTKLSVIDFSGGNSFTETPLSTTLTAGGGWKLIGFDADSFYVYRNAGTTFASQRSVLKITRSNPTASVLSTGTGLISVASMGRDVLYLTVFSQTDNSLIRVSKTGAAAVVTSQPNTTLSTVITGAKGVHQLWRVTNVGSGDQTYTVEMIDENGTVLYTGTAGWPMSTAEPDGFDANTSESRTRFLFATGYGSRGWGNASLISYDTASRSATMVGTFPGTAEFGSDFVFAIASGGPTNQGLAFAARSSNGTILETGAKVYSFDATSANSLKSTTASR